MDPKSLCPVQHRSTDVREDLLVLRAREVLVESRTKLISAVRSMVKTLGARVSPSSSDAFLRKAAKELPQQIRHTVKPLLDLIAQQLQQSPYIFQQFARGVQTRYECCERNNEKRKLNVCLAYRNAVLSGSARRDLD